MRLFAPRGKLQMAAPTNATPGPAQPAPVVRPAAAAAAQPVKINPTTISWKEPQKFTTDGSVITQEDFDSYEFGCRAANQPNADYTVIGHMPVQPGETTLAVASLSFPQNVILQFSVRVVATNGVRSKWCAPPALLKIDTREPEAPSSLSLS